MPTWTLWLFLAAVLILPVALRIYAGDEPDNTITQEQEPRPASRDRDGDAEMIAA